MPDLTLPEAVFVLAHSPSGQRDPVWSIVEPLVGAAVLAELYLAERIELDQDGVSVLVRSPMATGDALLDGVLARMVDSGAHSPVEWLAEFAPSVIADVVERLRDREVCEPDEPRGVRWLRFDVENDIRRPTREALAASLHDGDEHARVVVLGVLLAGAGLERTVASFGAKRRLRELAADDWLAVSLRSYAGYLGHVARGTTGRAYTTGEPAVSRRRRLVYWAALILVGVGIAGVSLLRQSHHDANAKALSDRGEPVMANVVDRTDKYHRKEKVTRSKLTLTYWYADKPHRATVACMRTCPAEGDRTRIMVDASQPRVFLTEWGEFTDASPDGDMMILVGGAAITVGLMGAATLLMPGGSGPRLSHPRRR
ncbi:GPP34 family phosphoprotein [Micromonospora sp. CPCC 205371]|nr:GPP34 family phosphoprotein [Micromonospora sp. CPCC 205371]